MTWDTKGPQNIKKSIPSKYRKYFCSIIRWGLSQGCKVGLIFKNQSMWEFHGCPGIRIPCFPCREHGLDPWWRNEDTAKKKKRERERKKTQLMTFTMISQQRGEIIYNMTGFTESIWQNSTPIHSFVKQLSTLLGIERKNFFSWINATFKTPTVIIIVITFGLPWWFRW